MQKTVFNDDVHLQPVSGRFRNEKKNLSFTSFACSSSQGVCALLEIGPFVLSQRMKEKDLGGGKWVEYRTFRFKVSKAESLL